MTYFVAYDIADPKRLRKVAKILENYGLRVQYSFFECEMESDILENMKKDLCGVIDKKEDSLRFYPLCEDCLHRTSTVGSGTVFVPSSFQIL
jgi:CRISPR-associated protein Cas2